MLPNDWNLLREAQEKMKASWQEAEAYRLAKLAAEEKPSTYQRFLVELGRLLSLVGNYLQMHFGADGRLPARQEDCP